MASKTSIEWTATQNEDGSVTPGFSWNFLRGCRRVSPGCENCYAERQAIRHAGPGGSYEGLVKSTPKGPRWTGKLSFHEDILLAPLKRRTPTKYFVNSMSDLFYEDVTDEMLDKAFAVMALARRHTFQILTKRPERMKAYFDGTDGSGGVASGRIRDCLYRWSRHFPAFIAPEDHYRQIANAQATFKWPIPNVWLGVSVENQEYADERIPLLLDTPASVRWISAEPLLGPINLRQIPIEFNLFLDALTGRNFIGDGRAVVDAGKEIRGNRLDWIVVGGESGPNSRQCDTAWIRSIVEQCTEASVPVFVKQLGGQPVQPFYYGDCGKARLNLKDRKGGDPSEWPNDLRVREFPELNHV